MKSKETTIVAAQLASKIFGAMTEGYTDEHTASLHLFWLIYTCVPFEIAGRFAASRSCARISGSVGDELARLHFQAQTHLAAPTGSRSMPPSVRGLYKTAVRQGQPTHLAIDRRHIEPAKVPHVRWQLARFPP